MNALLRARAVFVLAVRRLLHQRWLALAIALGLTAAVALTVSIPAYSDSVYNRALLGKLYPGQQGSGQRSSLVYTFHYVGAWTGAGPVEWEDFAEVDQYFSETGSRALGLPQMLVVRFFKTEQFRIFPGQDHSYAESDATLMWASLGFASDLGEHVTVLEGELPAAAGPSADSPIEVLISEALAWETGLQVGEEYIALVEREEGGAQRQAELPLQIAGVWRAVDPEEEYWFYSQEALEDVFLIAEESLADRVAPVLGEHEYLGLWHLVMDGSAVNSDNVAGLLAGTWRMEQEVTALLPDTRLAASPEDELLAYQKAVQSLTILLHAFNTPIIGLILVFVGLVVGLAVARRRNEIAILRSRGATTAQVVGIAALEGLVLAGVALAAGLLAGLGVARVIGRTRSFLDFTLQTDLSVGISAGAVRIALAGVGLALLALVLPTAFAARRTIIGYRQERARALERPWWQRAWIDVLLLIPAAYGAYLLREQGSIALPGAEGTAVGDPFRNPLLVLVPALGGLALSLLTLRILPGIIAVLARLWSHTRGVGGLLAVRYLARTPGFYSAPLVLLVLTLSLSIFTATVADTLDRHLHDSEYYRRGADMVLSEQGECLVWIPGQPPTCDTSGDRAHWAFLPAIDHLRAPGVLAVTRVGRYGASARIAGGLQTGSFLGLDWQSFYQVAFWREDFAAEHLIALTNALGASYNGVLVPRSLMSQHNLSVGDTFAIRVQTYKEIEIELEIVGSFDLFPTWYPEDGVLFVGNLDYLFSELEETYHYDVWLKTEPDANYEEIVAAARDMRLQVVGWDAPLVEITEEQQRPERQGLFGVLSVGFLSAAVLTVLGFLLYAFFSFRRRFIELGVLRAVGLSTAQMTSFLGWELVFLIGTGAAVGTGLGVLFSRLFIPALQIGARPEALIPPFLIDIAWSAVLEIYVLFALLFVLALAGLVVLLMRIKIFEAVKLGETV